MTTEAEAWAVTLTIPDDERLEDRIATIVQHETPLGQHAAWRIRDIDATGPFGGEVTARREREGVVDLTLDEMTRLLHEDGQVIELDATLATEEPAQDVLRIIVRDGSSVDVLGLGETRKQHLGQFTAVNPKLFMWPS